MPQAKATPSNGNQETAITVFDAKQYPLLALTPSAVKRVQRTVGMITLNVLPKARFTNKGHLEIPDESRSSGTRSVDMEGDGLDLIILAVNLDYRSAFQGGYDPSAPRPPLCWSHNSDRGEGAFKDRRCVTCPLYNTYEDEAGRKGGCWGKGQVIALLPGERLPFVIQIPLTGLKTFRQYLLKMGMADLDLWSVVTHLTVKMEGQHIRVQGKETTPVPESWQADLANHAEVLDRLLNASTAPSDAPTQRFDEDGSGQDYEEAAYRATTGDPPTGPTRPVDDADEIEI